MKISQLKLLGLIIGSSILLQGCVTATVVGVGAAAATKVATDPRTVGTQVDDETLEEKVLITINKDNQVKSEARVNIVSYSGNVLLIGQASNEMLKEQITNIAEGVENVKKVYNEMTIGSPIKFGQISKDSWITTQIKSKLLVDSNVKSTDIKAITENGEVFLMGNVTQNQANAAANVARHVPGVKKVVKVFNYIQ